MSRYARKQKLFPDRYPQNGSRPVRTVREFDDFITAPQFGYRDAQDYYDHVGAKRVAANVRVPLLMITAQDDPFVTYASFLAARSATIPPSVWSRPNTAAIAASSRNTQGTSASGPNSASSISASNLEITR